MFRNRSYKSCAEVLYGCSADKHAIQLDHIQNIRLEDLFSKERLQYNSMPCIHHCLDLSAFGSTSSSSSCLCLDLNVLVLFYLGKVAANLHCQLVFGTYTDTTHFPACSQGSPEKLSQAGD